jgi:hypothetical protein
MDKCRATRFLIENQLRIKEQVMAELPKVSKRKMSEMEVSELIGLVSSKMVQEDYALHMQ